MQICSAARLEKEYSTVAAQCARTGEAQVLAARSGSKNLTSDRVALEMGVVAAG